MPGQQMTIRRESAVPAGAPFVGVDQLLYNEADGGLYVKLTDGATRRINIPPSDARVSSGDARGADAIDLQYTRDLAQQVAFGARAAIIGGQKSRAGGPDSIVLAGEGNVAAGIQSVVGGQESVVAGFASAGFGKRVGVGGDFNFVSGEQSVIGSRTFGSTYTKATRVFTWNPASVQGVFATDAAFETYGCFLFSDDTGNFRWMEVSSADVGTGTLTFAKAPVDIEDDMVANADLYEIVALNGSEKHCLAVGTRLSINGNVQGARVYGFGCEIRDGADLSTAQGRGALSRLHGQHSFTNRDFGGIGNCQYSFFTAAASTGDATPAPLWLDLFETKRIELLSDNRAYAFRAMVLAQRNSVAELGVWHFTGVIKRGVGIGSVALVGAVTKTEQHKDVAAWECDIVADATNGALEIQVTGVAGVSIRWIAHLDWLELLQ